MREPNAVTTITKASSPSQMLPQRAQDPNRQKIGLQDRKIKALGIKVNLWALLPAGSAAPTERCSAHPGIRKSNKGTEKKGRIEADKLPEAGQGWLPKETPSPASQTERNQNQTHC